MPTGAQPCAPQPGHLCLLCTVVIDPTPIFSTRQWGWTGASFRARSSDLRLLGHLAPLGGCFRISVRTLEVMMNYMSTSRLPVSSRSLHGPRAPALHMLTIGWLMSQYSRPASTQWAQSLDLEAVRCTLLVGTLYFLKSRSQNHNSLADHRAR